MERAYGPALGAVHARAAEREEELRGATASSCSEDPTRAVTAIHAMGRFGAAFAAREPAAAARCPR